METGTKKIIIEAAVALFNTKGYNGTSIRDIAGNANVNIANISYYFKNKQGLLEYCITDYYERYLLELENGYKEIDKGATISLKKTVRNLILFQSQNSQLTRFILRELSLDSQMVREIMATYLVKERYFFQKILEKGMAGKEFKVHSINYLIMQLKALLSMPFLNSHYAVEVLHIFPQEHYFSEKYSQDLNTWIDALLTQPYLKKIG
ncbi:forespore capture DNA-binding protein RefZ [Bacillaceae bacterium Marseille-Q3522]|nr:forespore capture DNA-binding protein RefZ [Bacillaceae bacterium Marseille-Q3522]